MTALAVEPGFSSKLVGGLARHQRDDPEGAAGHVHLRHDAVALDVE